MPPAPPGKDAPKSKQRRKQWQRPYMERSHYAQIQTIATRSGVSVKSALAMIVDHYLHGPSARLRSEVRARCHVIALNARLDYREAVNGSDRARRSRDMERAAIEISTLMGDGEDGIRVGQFVVLPRHAQREPVDIAG